ncbi:MAG: hypothetical protein Kow0047_17200 [Anaerolineae bacterium]
MDREVFARLVKEALTHLYDHAYLQAHPLSALLAAEGEVPIGGMTLHRVLMEELEALRPSPRIPPTAPPWRPYRALYLRYVENRDAAQAAEEMAISPRQLRREHAKGLQALTERLWKRYLLVSQGSRVDGAEGRLLSQEVERLEAASSERLTAVEPAIHSVLSTIAELASQRRVSVAVDIQPPAPVISVGRVVFRQALLSIMTHLLHRGHDGAIQITARQSEQHLILRITYRGALEEEGASYDDERLEVASRLLNGQGGQLRIVNDQAPVIELVLPAQRPPAVLVVDDNPDVIQLFQRYLAGSVYRVVGATDSREAMRLALEEQPHAITLDVMMPDQDGWELLQNLKNHPRTARIPVIVCSVLRERELALSLGADEFIAKPVAYQDLLTALARCQSRPARAEHRG